MPVDPLAPILLNLPPFARAAVDRESALAELRATRHSIEPVAHPRVYQLETTSRCNLACPFCPRTTDLLVHSKRDLTATMTLADFEAILDKMPTPLRSLELFHFGEPFMHRDLEDYVAACRARGIYTVVASNLLPATPPKVTKVFEAGLDFLVMDVDSLDAQRYERARVGGSLALLRERVLDILSREKRPYCVAQTILLDGRPEYTEADFVEWTGGLRADEVRYKFVDSFRGEIEDQGALAPDDLCREPFYGFSVHVNGDVVPCDRDWAGEAVMGNVLLQSVEEIWTGERYQRFREQMKSRNKPALCRRCPQGRLANLRSQPHVQVNMFRGMEVEW